MPHTTPPPDVSVLLATRDRADLLEATLGHLATQQLAGRTWEVITADNGSTDRTPAVLRDAAARLPLLSVTEPAPGKNRALNRALDLARGQLWLFTDDDVVPEPDWVAQMAAAADRWPEHAIFGGRIEPLLPPETPGWLREHPFTEAAYARFDLPVPEGPITKLPFGPNFMVRAEAMTGMRYNDEIGPEGEDYVAGSETELLLRLTQRGHRIVWVPGASVGHVVRASQLEVEWLFGRAYRLGRCLVELDFVQRDAGARIGGAPVAVWARLAKEWVFRLSGAFGGPRRRFLGGLDYHFLRGCVRQHRLRARRPPSPAAG
jgi:glycosyltransferase involved in cell wall biosynthesis